MDIHHRERVRRNDGYGSEAVQERLAGLRMPVAGCGMGSALAAAPRLILLSLGDSIDGGGIDLIASAPPG